MLAAIALVSVATDYGKWIVVQRLASRIRTSDDSSAARLVRELAAFGPTAYPSLVVAVNSKRSAVALTARAEIDELIDQWHQAVYLHPSSFDLGQQAVPLAAAFEKQLPAMTASGRRWGRRAIAGLLQLARQQEFGDRLALIMHCDRALAALPPDDPSSGFEPDVDYRLTLAPSPRPSVFDGPVVDEPRSIDLPPPASRPTSDVATEGLAASESLVLEEIPPTAPAALESALLEWKLQRPVSEALQADGLPPGATGRVSARSASARELAPPPTSLDTGTSQLNMVGTPHISDRAEEMLFQLLASGDEKEQAAASEAIQVRGYGNAIPRDARMLLSASAADRVALVDVAMTSTRLESHKWLWRLAHDLSGEVRAAAIAGISTSGDRELVEAALRLALRDTDPRVAEQASVLRSMLK